jgi:hypothetical protein
VKQEHEDKKNKYLHMPKDEIRMNLLEKKGITDIELSTQQQY